MRRELSIVAAPKNYRDHAKEMFGLTDEQMKGYHVHHRVPRSKGGSNHWSNLVVVHPWVHANVYHADDHYKPLVGYVRLASQARKPQRHTEETKERLRQIALGRKIPPETRAKMSISQKKRTGRLPPTLEQRKAISKTLTGRPSPKPRGIDHGLTGSKQTEQRKINHRKRTRASWTKELWDDIVVALQKGRYWGPAEIAKKHETTRVIVGNIAEYVKHGFTFEQVSSGEVKL